MKKIFPQIDASTFLCAVLLLAGTFSFSQKASQNIDTPAAAHMRLLNNSLLRLHGQMQQADASSARMLRSQATTVIAQRAAVLSQLIQNEPHAALTFAFSPELLTELSNKFPQAAGHLESHTTITGQVQHWVADYSRGSHSWWTMKASAGTVNLHFAEREPANLKSGQLLQATGIMVGPEMAVEAGIPIESSGVLGAGSPGPGNKTSHGQPWTTSFALFSVVVFGILGIGWEGRISRSRIFALLKHSAIFGLVFALVVISTPGYAQNSCSTTGVQKTIVILATFPGVTPPSTLTPQSVSGMFFSATAPSLTSYWQEASYGSTSAAGDVFGWYTLTGSYNGCQSLNQVQSDAMSAAAASGANFQNYDRVVVVFPDTLGCGWSGLSSIGCSSLNTPSGTINASSSYLAAAYASVQVATHELGHALGLAHASSRGFTDSSGNLIPLGPLGTRGNLTEYGDKFSTMSCCTGNLGAEYAAPHKAEVLNWLAPNTDYQTVQATGTYTLQPYEASGGLKAIKVQRGAGNDAWLWVEYRQSNGSYDTPQLSGGAFPSPVNTILPPQPYSGALIHYEDSNTGLYTNLLNYTPSDTSFLSPALLAGHSWTDPYTNLSLSVQSAAPTGLTVNVNYGSTPCTQGNPTVTSTPLDPSVYPGNTAGYNVSVTNNDSAACSASTFNMGSTLPSGWQTSFSSSSLTLSPGQTGSVTMNKTGPSSTNPGTYGVNSSATNAANSAFAGNSNANVTVMTPPSVTVSVSVPSTSYTRKSTVPMTATVLYGGVPAAGANVAFTLTQADGSKVPQSATTGSNGTATWNYKLSPRSPTGTYSVTAQATANSTSASSNNVSFTVTK